MAEVGARFKLQRAELNNMATTLKEFKAENKSFGDSEANAEVVANIVHLDERLKKLMRQWLTWGSV